MDLNGIFQIDCHSSSSRFMWMSFIPFLLSIVAFGIWAVKVDLFDFSKDIPSDYFKIALASLFFLVGPTVIFIIGLIKIIKKPGIYFKGVRITNIGIEIGTFALDVNSASFKETWENKFIADDMLGEWKQKKLFSNKAINILIVLRKKYELSEGYLLERVVFSSRDECLFQMFGHNSAGTRWNNLVALSQGSFHLLGNDDGIYPDDLLSFREQTADIVSRWKSSFVLSCTLKMMPSLVNLDEVFAFGVLGGINVKGTRSIDDREYQEIIFDNLNNEKNSSVDLNQE